MYTPPKYESRFFQFTRICIIAVYLVIVAGAVVRMSGAGMGCPDWPTCFGKIIPPTDVSQLPENYQEIYAERGYADTEFNAFHTWTEYVNRLVGAVAGLLTLILAIWSVKFLKKDPWVFFLSLATVLAMGFQGWLGAVVVYSVLQPFKITIHMLMALVIVFLLLHVYIRSYRGKLLPLWRDDAILKKLTLGLIVALLIQTVLGTQVREAIDHIADTMGPDSRSVWIDNIGFVKVLHRSFAWIPFALGLAILYRNAQKKYKMASTWIIFGILVLEIGSGILLYYTGMPAYAQPIHLVLSTVLIGITYFLYLKLNRLGRN